jgi:hypothetical protein
MFSRNATLCEFRDVIAPLVYGLLTCADAQTSLQSAFPGINISTPAAALAWINSNVTQGHLSNLSALFLWYCHQYLP